MVGGSLKSIRKDEKGVSPIVGVILVVVMTVMLAIIAWNYLGGLTSTGPGKMHSVAAKAERSSDGKYVTVTYEGGPDANLVKNIAVTATFMNGTNVPWYNSTGSLVNTSPVNLGSKVGSFVTFVTNGQKVHITVTASFKDGTNQTIFDRDI